MTGSHRSGADSPLDRRLQSIRVTDPSHETAAGRRTGGIDTVSTSFDTVLSAESRVTAGLPTDRGSFTGLLGFGLARHSSPVTLTFRHPHADAPTETPFDSPSDGSPDVSSALQDRSTVAADHDRPPRVADTTIPTLHRLSPRSSSTMDFPHQTGQKHQSPPLANRSTDASPTVRLSVQDRPTWPPVPHRPRRTAPGQSTAHRLSVRTHPQPSVSLTDSAQPAPDTHTADSGTAGWVGSQPASRPHRPRRDLRYRSVEQDRPSHLGGLSGSVITADGFVDTDIFESRTHGFHDRSESEQSLRHAAAAVDHGQPSVDTVQLHTTQSAVSVRAATGWPAAADQHSTQSQPAARSSPNSATRSAPTTQPAARSRAATADSEPPLRVGGTTSVSSRASGLLTTRRWFPTPEQSPQAQTPQPRRASDSSRPIHSAVGSARSPPITADAARSDFGPPRGDPNLTQRPIVASTTQPRMSDLSTRPIGQSSTTRDPFTVRTAGRFSTNTFGLLTVSGVDFVIDTGSVDHTLTRSTASIDRRPATEAGELLSPSREDNRPWHQPAGRHRLPSPVVPTRVLAPVVSVASSVGPRGRGDPSSGRRFHTDRVFAPADTAVPSAHKQATLTTVDSHGRRRPANTVPSRPEQPAAAGRSTDSQRRPSRKHTRGTVLALQTALTADAPGASTATDAAARSRPVSDRLSQIHRSQRQDRGPASSVAISRIDHPHDSSSLPSQQSRQPRRLQPSARSWTPTDSYSAVATLQRQPEPMRPRIEPTPQPHRASHISLAPLAASDPSADSRGVDSVHISRWPVTASSLRFTKPPRQHPDSRSQPTLTAVQPPAGGSDRSWPTHNPELTGGSPTTLAPTLSDGVSTASRRPTLSCRATRPNPSPSDQDSPTVRSRSGLSASVDRIAESRLPTGSQTGLTATPETTAVTTARSRPVAASRAVPSPRVAGRLAPLGHADSAAPAPPTETEESVAGSASPRSPRHSLRQSAVVSRHPLTATNDTGPTARDSDPTASRPVAPRQQSVLEPSQSADRHQLLSSLARRPLRTDTEPTVTTPQTTGIAPPASSSDVSDITPPALAVVRQSTRTAETDVDQSRLPTRQDVAGRSVAPDSPPATLSWLSQPIDRPIHRLRQSTAVGGESEPTPRPSESAGFRPRRSAGGLWHTEGLGPSSHRHHRNHSPGGQHSDPSSSLASVPQHSEQLRSDTGVVEDKRSVLNRPFKQSTAIASDRSSPGTNRSRRTRSATGVLRTVTPRDDSYPGTAPHTTVRSRLDPDGLSRTSIGSTPTLVDREPGDTGPDASVLSVPAARPMNTASSDSGRNPDAAIQESSRVAGRRPRSARSSSLTQAIGAGSSTESQSQNTGRRRAATDGSSRENSRPQLTFKKPLSQRGSESDHDAAGSRGTADHRHRRGQSTATDGRAGSQETPQPRSDRHDRTTSRSDPFEPVERPDRQPTPPTDQESVRSAAARRDPDRRSHDGLGDSISGASLAYDADVDRVVETLYRRLERKLRIERERTGF